MHFTYTCARTVWVPCVLFLEGSASPGPRTRTEDEAFAKSEDDTRSTKVLFILIFELEPPSQKVQLINLCFKLQTWRKDLNSTREVDESIKYVYISMNFEH